MNKHDMAAIKITLSKYSESINSAISPTKTPEANSILNKKAAVGLAPL